VKIIYPLRNNVFQKNLGVIILCGYFFLAAIPLAWPTIDVGYSTIPSLSKVLVAEICGILTENVIANKLTHGPPLINSFFIFHFSFFIRIAWPTIDVGYSTIPSLSKVLVAEICGILTENVIANKLTHGPPLINSFFIFHFSFFIRIAWPTIDVGYSTIPSLSKVLVAEICGTFSENVIANKR
jgi:hypothetical protein